MDGRALSQKIKESLKLEINELKSSGITPGLAVILLGQDKASMTYVANKEKAAKTCGINSSLFRLSQSTSEDELLGLIDKLNKDKNIDGILVQLPLPAHINSSKIIQAIDPNKDVDGFHPINMGRLISGLDSLVPCTPLGIMELYLIFF